ncbi:MAG: hypothetical protein WCT49_02805 [Candidatus Paceibacterota bacterium]|jgi:hypothetical protein|nr:hypothetical protein [Candidatus Paceibacterota bacterium]
MNQQIPLRNKISLFALPLLLTRGASAAVVTFTTPTPKVGTLYDFVVEVLKIVIKIGIPVVVILFIWTGYLFVTAQGDTTQLQTAKKAFFGSVIGATILLCAVLIATIIKATIGELGG